MTENQIELSKPLTIAEQNEIRQHIEKVDPMGVCLWILEDEQERWCIQTSLGQIHPRTFLDILHNDISTEDILKGQGR